MLPSEHINNYLDQICGQVRWKKAHRVIRRELEDHMIDQAQAFEDEGNSPEKAAEMAVLEMGDPVLIGTQFDRSYRPGFNWPILVTALLLIVFGILTRTMMYASYSNETSVRDTILTLLISVVIVLSVLKIDYTILSRTRLIYGAYLVGSLLFYALLWLYGRWMLLQSYFLITAMPLTCCSLIYRMRNGGLKQVLFCYVMSMLPLLVLHSMFGAVFMSVLVVTLLLVTAIRQGAFTALKYRRCTCGMLIFTTLADPLIVAAVLRPEIMQRVLSPLLEHPDMAGYGYTAMLLREALAQARWFGPAENFAEMLFPFGGVDYLPVWLVCRFGWIAFLAILALLGAMCLFAVRIYRRQSGLLAKLVVCAVFGVWGVQALSSLLVGFGVVFMFSYPFPFFGGNMALMFNAVLLGLMLSVCQMGTLGSAVENRPVIGSGSLGMIRFEISRNRILLERRQKSGNDA